MKKRRSSGYLWLGLPLIPLGLFLAVAIFAGRPDSKAIATRGAKPPEDRKFTIASPASWNVAFDWMGEGMDSFMTWDINPWKRDRGQRYPGLRLMQLKDSTDPADQAEFQRLMKLGKEWYERILARYPELTPDLEKKITPDGNGYLKLVELARKLKRDNHQPMVPNLPGWTKGLNSTSRRDAWNSEEATAWIDANRGLLDEFRAIGLLTEQSSAGLSSQEVPASFAMMAKDGANALLMDARLSIERGDIAGALESFQAASGLADHLLNQGSQSLLTYLVGSSIKGQLSSVFFSEMMPNIPSGKLDLGEWQRAAGPAVESPDRFAEVSIGVWNDFTTNYMLPAYSDSSDTHLPPDPEQVAEVYTRKIQALVSDLKTLPANQLDSLPLTTVSDAGLSRRGREDLNGFGFDAMVNGWKKRQTTAGMQLAAFAILQGQPVPNDPISGKPYQWNPQTRTLSMPAGVKNGNNRVLVLPPYN